MPTKQDILQTIVDCGVVAIVRLNDSSQLERVGQAIQTGGLNVIEFTMTTPGALRIIEEWTRARAGKVLLGAGTVLDPETARAAILAGAEFIVSPSTNHAVVEMCNRYGKVVMPGAYTPTEIVAAMEMGADLVKLFPASSLGPSYIKAIRGPLPHARLVPTGGVSVQNAAEFIRAGAAALAVGGELVNNAIVERGEFDKITEAARQFREEVRKARM
ncbi:MAG: bifunctional 2-keto-4-hydroxyglutarate aldolase/2-keto-3-deoxy-6-phosphogluconate aldolase [Candidatus Sumerlaeota bacterium]|nr:bifunctional 2-keto-4-hydroxyglutarate aldolase/2-keto-3-deoxy-6-phosphogluconate aldolase [Candidatus Sumerlaeota bacterium]